MIAQAISAAAATWSGVAPLRSSSPTAPSVARSFRVSGWRASMKRMTGVIGFCASSGHSPIAAPFWRKVARSSAGTLSTAMPLSPTASLPRIWSPWQAPQVASNGFTTMARPAGPIAWQVVHAPGTSALSAMAKSLL